MRQSTSCITVSGCDTLFPPWKFSISIATRTWQIQYDVTLLHVPSRFMMGLRL